MDLISLLEAAVQHSASDVHLTTGMPPLARVNGLLIPLAEESLDSESCRNLIFSILSEIQRSRFEEQWELDFVLDINGIGRFRSNAHFSRGGPEAAFRLIPQSIPNLTELGHHSSLEALCAKEEGLILVTGATGSGKSTTLAAMIQAIVRQRSCLVVTIEDPIEYLFDNALGVVKQREIGMDTKSFQAALRHVLRQDPDVIVVSEMRDRETIQAAITAAETGHLVLGTLHTIDAPKSIDRMVDIFPGDQQNQITTQLSNCLQAVVSQRLLPHANGQGRALASEIMIVNSGIRACLRDHKTHMIYGLMEIGGQIGMHTIDECLADLLVNGHITYEEALLNARDATRIPEPETEPVKKGFFR
jgi:twitching motility protein PilT